jgi:antitoxin (DNA-binding transcriptional repressor) of toxin-antitoxin stability system
MKTTMIREVRQRGPKAKAALRSKDEIIVTRDSKPVAKLARVTQAEAKRPRWTPEAHRKWIKKVFGNKVFPCSDEPLAAARADRKLTSGRASGAIARASRP